jgi:nucleotide-binding universal stress UspA family protein
MELHADTPPSRAADAPSPRGGVLTSAPRAAGRILVCVDRSPSSEGCLQHAVDIAAGLGGDITLLHVMETPSERYGAHTSDVLDWEMRRQEAGTRLEQLSREGARAGAQTITPRLEQGHPAERILAVALEIDATLTVLAGHGERGLSAWSLGSTVQQVLSMTHGSVLVARSPPPNGSGPVREAPPRRILVPLDGSPRTESVLPTAARIALAHGAELLLAFVVAEPIPTAVLAEEDLDVARDLARRLEKRAHDYLDRVRRSAGPDGSRVRTLVLRSDDERRALLDLSERERVDLIVLSAHGSTCNRAGTFGSVATYVLLHAVVSVLVLQDLPDSSGPEQEGRSAPPPRALYAGSD